MIKTNENLSDKEKVKFDLYKILRMSILLNQGENDKDTLRKFKESSISIDKALNDKYNLELEDMFYSTDTLEEEEKRLKKLVSFIKDRINERKSLIDDYRTVTSKSLNDLEYINKSSELDLYENRLSLIKEYLDNSKLLEIETEDLNKLRSDLVEEIEDKKENEKRNVTLEEELNNAFVNDLYDMDLFNEISENDIDIKLDELRDQIIEAKEQKDTFLNAFSNLKSSGISGELEVEYSSYVENAKRNYYYLKEKEILYKLYKLISVKQKEYGYIFSKREDVKELLKERLLLRNDLGIKDKDNLSNIYDVIKEHNSIILEEKKTQENINVLTERVKIKEKKCDNLTVSLKRPEILSILSEYSLIDTYNNDDIDNSLLDDESENEIEDVEDNNSLNYSLLDSLDSSSEDIEEDIDNNSFKDEEIDEDIEVEDIKTYKVNEVKNIEVLPTMNCGLSRLKSISVMKKVADMLGIKREVKKDEKIDGNIDVKLEDTKLEENKVENTNEIKEEEKKEEDLFWTPVELQSIKNDINDNEKNVEIENASEDIFLDDKKDIFLSDSDLNSLVDNSINNSNNKQDDNLFVDNNNNNNNIFETNNGDGDIIFPEPIRKQEDEKEDKFMWPNNNINEVDINSIFPN